LIKSNQVYILDLTFGISFDLIVTKNYKNLIIIFYNNYNYFLKKILIKKKQFVPFLFLPIFLLGCLIRCMHKFFDIYLRVVLIYIYVQNLVEETIWSMLVQESLKVLGALRLLSLGRKIYFFKTSDWDMYHTHFIHLIQTHRWIRKIFL